MRLVKYIFLAVAGILVLSAFKSEQKLRIFMIGDSTMANKDVSGGKLERGWGMMFKNFFTDNVVVNNHALNGRSSKSFIAEGHWQKVVEQIRPGDYVFIQFGHNDEKADTLRHTDPGTSFDDNLRRFVNETRRKGGIPVLFNSVVRRTFADSKTAVEDDDKRDNSSNYLAEGDTLVDTHGAYLLSPRNVAVELDVPFVDANKITHDLEEGLGPDGSKKLHMWYRPGEVEYLPDGRQDNTHYNVYGAYIVAGLLAEAVADEVPELKDYFRHYDMSVANDGSGLYFDLQSAIDAAEPGSSVTILVGEGEWAKPSIPKNKKIKFVLSSGAKWL